MNGSHGRLNEDEVTRIAPGQAAGAPRQSARRHGTLRGLLRAARPRQWLKNLLVLAAPTFAGVLGEPSAILATAVAFAAFCLAASGTYLINDARDVEADRAHLRKRHRPVAAGVVGVRTALVAGVAGLLAAVGLSASAGSAPLVAVVLAYVVLTTAYSFWLKHIVILDLMGVAAGFVLRAVAGAAAVQVAVSSWFLIVATLGSLLIVAGKRESELRTSEPRNTELHTSRPHETELHSSRPHETELHSSRPDETELHSSELHNAGHHRTGLHNTGLHNTGAHRTEFHNTEGTASRATLSAYTSDYLRYIRSTTSGALLVSYCLWALDLHTGTAQVLFGLSIVPVALGILRYAMLVDQGYGESPEDLFLSDRMLLLSGLVVALLLAAGVYVV